jgi:hypothetical protein
MRGACTATVGGERHAIGLHDGYHPNVAAPGHGINFIWMMAARREVEDRQFGVVGGFGNPPRLPR